MKRFYYNPPLTVGEHLSLPMEIVRHIFALRLNTNEEIILFNGQGKYYTVRIISIDRKSVVVDILDENIILPNSKEITLGISLIANDKMDFAIQKAVELGVNRIIPIISQYSQHLNADRVIKKLEHWQSIIISSCEQCGQNYLPIMDNLTKLTDVINSDGYDAKLWLSIQNQQKYDMLLDTQKILLIVGPEGGFSLSEEEQFIKSDFIPMNLGSLILRAETAVCAGLSLVNYLSGRING